MTDTLFDLGHLIKVYYKMFTVNVVNVKSFKSRHSLIQFRVFS